MIYKTGAGFETTKKYMNVDSQDYFQNPKKYQGRKEMYSKMGMDEEECIPVNSFGDFASVKGEEGIMEKTQCNIRERFGYTDEVDQY